MAWYQKNHRAYFSRSFRLGGERRTFYFGRGVVGQLAAELEAQHRAQRQAQRDKQRRWEERLSLAEALAGDYARQIKTLRDAALLMAGYYRPDRHAWRKHALRKRRRRATSKCL